MLLWVLEDCASNWVYEPLSQDTTVLQVIGATCERHVEHNFTFEVLDFWIEPVMKKKKLKYSTCHK